MFRLKTISTGLWPTETTMTFENEAEFQVTPGTTGKNLKKKSEGRFLPKFTSYFKVTFYAPVLTSLMLHQELISNISGSLSSELIFGRPVH